MLATTLYLGDNYALLRFTLNIPFAKSEKMIDYTPLIFLTP